MGKNKTESFKYYSVVTTTMAYEIHDVNGLKVHTGDFSTTPEHLDSLKRVTSVVTDAYFCKRTPDGFREKVLYDPKAIKSNKAGLGLTIKSPDGEQATLHVGGLDNVMSALSDLEVTPESLALAVGREVCAYRDSLTLYGIWIPTFARERRVA
jgi:hypothetical protein